ncbi:uncharacterized protein LOC118442349 [Vespa mandarinia]|uniref:uncharacterized protein LOC118442349 n=1 Tax=Vespa mandarinia TaxID=7446 RepID=UPI00161C3C3E|nr:uncharacterized protein LOC118442349 [Vespa mandarinia]
MAKRKLPKEVYHETENSDEEFSFDFLNTDSDIEIISSDSEVEENDENENSSINEFTTCRDVTHKDQKSPQSKINFSTGSKIVGPNVLIHCTESIDFFRLFFTDILLEKIVLKTNKYAKNKIEQQNLSNRSTRNNCVDVTKEELTAFVGVILNMGIISIPNMKCYWTKEHAGNIPFFGNIFRRERFL